MTAIMVKPAKHEPELVAAKPRVRGVSKNSAEARRKILDSAMLIFGSQGFARTTTEQIAEHAGYGQASVFFHFKTKSRLLEACLENALEQARQGLVVAENSGTLELVQRLDRAFDNSPTADFFARMMIEFGESSAVQPVYASFHAHLREVIAAELIRETGADSESAATAAATILSMMVGIHAEQRLETRQFTRADFRKMLLNVTRLILRDLACSAGAEP
jgi:AcrR family transcriptional regulator